MFMRAFAIRVLINAVGLFVATKLIPGIAIGAKDYWLTLLAVALIFGVVNALVKPVLTLLTLPITVLTLGLFLLVLNALMLLLTSVIAGALGLSFHVDGFLAALIGSILISIVSFVLDRVIPD